MTLHNAYIALGSNLANPPAQLVKAQQWLAADPLLTLLRCSSFYQSEAMAAVAQPDFINAVMLLQTPLSASALLAKLLAIEKQCGRKRPAVKNAARVIDLDLLFYDELQLAEPDLCLPHPRLQQRLFVLLPLQEILSSEWLPDGRHLPSLIKACAAQRIAKIAR